MIGLKSFYFVKKKWHRVTLVVFPVKNGWPLEVNGVPQGSILGSILFYLACILMIYMVCQQCNILMYADDTVMFTHGKNGKRLQKC